VPEPLAPPGGPGGVLGGRRGRPHRRRAAAEARAQDHLRSPRLAQALVGAPAGARGRPPRPPVRVERVGDRARAARRRTRGDRPRAHLVLRGATAAAVPRPRAGGPLRGRLPGGLPGGQAQDDRDRADPSLQGAVPAQRHPPTRGLRRERRPRGARHRPGGAGDRRRRRPAAAEGARRARSCGGPPRARIPGAEGPDRGRREGARPPRGAGPRTRAGGERDPDRHSPGRPGRAVRHRRGRELLGLRGQPAGRAGVHGRCQADRGHSGGWRPRSDRRRRARAAGRAPGSGGPRRGRQPAAPRPSRRRGAGGARARRRSEFDIETTVERLQSLYEDIYRAKQARGSRRRPLPEPSEHVRAVCS
jgi:hypothetical protein